MREIKFRAWDTETHKFIWSGFERFTSESHEDKPADKRKGSLILNGNYAGFGNRVIFQQYTGLKDKNGREIYEGDIVRIYRGHFFWLNMSFKTVFYEGAFCMEPVEYRLAEREKPIAFITYGDACFTNGLGKNFEDYIEIIGNIYENPELLNNGQEDKRSVATEAK